MDLRYDLIEKDFVDRLRPEFSQRIDVVQTPQSESEFKRPLLNGRITVVYSNSGYEPPSSTNEIRQLETLQFEIHIQAKSLRGTDGLHDITIRSRKALAGWMPENCSKVWMVSNSFIERDEVLNVFTYMMKVSTTYLFVEDADEEDGTPFSGSTFNINPNI